MPDTLLSLCQVNQAWTTTVDDTKVINDGVRMVSMSTLEAMNSRLDNLTDMLAQVNLISDINVRDAGKKKGLFVDPFLNDTQRDALPEYGPGKSATGVAYQNLQTLAITGGCLQLPIAGTALEPTPRDATEGITEVTACDTVDEVVLGNTARTSDMKVNPYMAFDAFPAKVTITPQIDRWVDTKTVWTGPETRYFTITEFAPWTLGNVHGQTRVTGTTTTNELAGTKASDLEYLRQITINFTISGFKANETLSKVLFDGIDVTP